MVYFSVNIALIGMTRNITWGTALPSTAVEGGRGNMTCFASGTANNNEWMVDLYDNYTINNIEITVPDSNG